MIELLGSAGSPYTRKMLAVLRYRLIPYRVHWTIGTKEKPGYPKPKVPLLPTFYFPLEGGGFEAVVDSTPLIRRLEEMYGPRAILPPDPTLQYLNDLIEDYADEWVTKMMFHYRWAFQKDADNAGPLLVHWAFPSLDQEKAKSRAADFADRQINRLYVVGSNEVTRKTIEESYKRLIAILDDSLKQSEFLFGARPASADFALYGQLTQLGIVEPTSAAILSEMSPRLRAWIDRMEDLSGLDVSGESWDSVEDVMARLLPLLTEIGLVYLPFLVANGAAVQEGLDQVETEIDGRSWVQPTFPYQVKCLRELRRGADALPAESRKLLEPVLSPLGFEVLFA